MMSKSNWQQALETAASSRKRSQNGTVLVLGTPSCGKSTLIRGLQRYAAGGADRLRPDEAYFNTGGAPIVDAAALPVRASTDVSGDFTYQTCALLVLQNPKWSHIAGTILRRRWMQCGLKGTTLLIVVGLNDMVSAYEEAESWLKFASSFIPEQVQKTEQERPSWTPPIKDSFLENYADMREQNKALLAACRARIEKQRGGEPTEETASPQSVRATDSDIINTGVQIVVCGCKADKLPSVGFSPNPEKLAEELIFTVYMREMCRQYGATLLFLNAEDDENSNQARLNTLITSPITKENILLPPMTNSAVALYIPAGWDSAAELQQMGTDCGVSSLSVPLQTLVKRSYDNEDITSKLEDKSKDLKVAVPPPFDQFLKNIANQSDGDIPGPPEPSRILKLLEDEGKKGTEESLGGGKATPSRVESGPGPVTKVTSTVKDTPAPTVISPPPQAPSGGAMIEKQTSRKAQQDPEPIRAARLARDKGSIRAPREEKDSARKAGTSLVSSLLSDLKKTKTDGKPRS